MRRLILLRHAKTEKTSATGQDRDRRLDERGRNDAAALGRYLTQHGLRPELALISPAARVRETWELVAAEMPKMPRTKIVQELYGADPVQLLKVARAADEEQPAVMMIVGHNPGIHEFAITSMRGARAGDRTALVDGMPTCALVVLDFPTGDWREIAFRTAQLERFVSPRLLRDAAG
jgi:phosphohistidine phosphatase